MKPGVYYFTTYEDASYVLDHPERHSEEEIRDVIWEYCNRINFSTEEQIEWFNRGADMTGWSDQLFCYSSSDVDNIIKNSKDLNHNVILNELQPRVVIYIDSEETAYTTADFINMFNDRDVAHKVAEYCSGQAPKKVLNELVEKGIIKQKLTYTL